MGTILKKSFQEWQNDHAPQMAAAVAYYAIFSIAPVLLLVIAVAGIFFDSAFIQHQLIGQISLYVGPNAAQSVASLITAAHQSTHSGYMIVVGFIVMLLGATGFMLSIQDAFNLIWKVETKKEENAIWMIVVKRCVSVLFIIVMGCLFLGSLAVSTAFFAVMRVFTMQIPAASALLPVSDFVVSFLVILVLVAILFKYLPDVHVGWKDVWIGAAITSVLFTIGKNLLGWYLGSGNATSAYGAAASLIILLLWIFYSSQILFFGVEFTKVYAKERHLMISPRHYAQFTEPFQKVEKRKITFLPDLATIMGFLLLEAQAARWFFSIRKKWKMGRKLFHRT